MCALKYTDEKEEEISSFESLLDLAGTNGWRNYAVFFGAALMPLLGALPTFSYQFLGATPDYWCHVEPLMSMNWTSEQIKDFAIPYTERDGKRVYDGCTMFALNYTDFASMSYDDVRQEKERRPPTQTVPCSSRDFETNVETIVNTWDLVCERRSLYSTSQAVIYVGQLVGFLIGGYFIDSFGRSFVYKTGATLSLIPRLLSIASPNISTFITLRFIGAALGSAAYLACFVLSIEFCSVNQRTVFTSFMGTIWAFGIMITPMIAYVVRPWKELQLALTLPSLLLFLTFWTMPESPRWLIIKGRHMEALTILTKIARSNNKKLPSKECLLHDMQRIQCLNTETEPANTNSLFDKILNVFKHVTCVFVDKRLRGQTLAMFFCWFSAALVYYGISLVSPSFSMNPYVYIFLSGLIEIPSYLFLYPSMKYLGRKQSLVILFFSSALSLLAALAMMLVSVQYDMSNFKLVLFISGKFSITAALQLLCIYTAELYPTHLRSLIIGQSSSVARIGSICSPYINDILGMHFAWAPAALFGGVSLVAGVVSFSFAETKDQELQDSMKKLID